MARFCLKTGESSNAVGEEISVKLTPPSSDEEMARPIAPTIKTVEESALVQGLRRGMNAITKAPAKSNIVFQNMEAAATHNAKVLEEVTLTGGTFSKNKKITDFLVARSLCWE